MTMTNEETKYYELAEQYASYQDLSLKAMALLAHENKKSPTAMRVFSFCWQRNARHMAKAVDLFGRFFTEDGYTAKDLSALIGMAGVNKVERDWLYTDWREGRLDSHGVLQRVAELKTPKPREKRVNKADKMKQVGDALAAAVRSNHLQGQADYDFECHVCKCLKAWEEL